MPALIEMRPLEQYRLWVRYSDGVEGVVDLSDFAGDGVFALFSGCTPPLCTCPASAKKGY